MECKNCGASLMSSLICEYCGENNAPGKQDEVPDKEEIEFQIELLEDKIRQNAKQNREAGDPSMMGPHASDIRVTHIQKNQFAEEASTGEQKALLISFILAHAHLQSDRLKKPPLLLLDDVAALLDTCLSVIK